MIDHLDHPDHRLSLHWRTTSHRKEMTEQEAILAKWLDDQGVSFAYEQLLLIKNNDLAGQEVVHGKKVRKKDVLRSVPDFTFQDGEELFFIEMTTRRRPSVLRPNRLQADPKRRVRHLARLAQIDCAIIYRDELESFVQLFQKLDDVKADRLATLHKTVKEWLNIEWKE